MSESSNASAWEVDLPKIAALLVLVALAARLSKSPKKRRKAWRKRA